MKKKNTVPNGRGRARKCLPLDSGSRMSNRYRFTDKGRPDCSLTQ